MSVSHISGSPSYWDFQSHAPVRWSDRQIGVRNVVTFLFMLKIDSPILTRNDLCCRELKKHSRLSWTFRSSVGRIRRFGCRAPFSLGKTGRAHQDRIVDLDDSYKFYETKNMCNTREVCCSSLRTPSRQLSFLLPPVFSSNVFYPFPSLFQHFPSFFHPCRFR